MDVISMHQYGFTNAVASLGTSFCEEHARLLKRYTNNVVICYDGDEAGRNALKKAAAILLDNGISARAAVLKGGKDPDEILKNNGEEYFENILKEAKPYVEYMLDIEKEKHDLMTVSGKAEYASAVSEYLSLVSGEVERELYIKKISDDIGISGDVVRSEYNKKFKTRQREEKHKEEVKEKYRSSKTTDLEKLKDALKNCEGELINILINDRVCFNKLKDKLEDDFFTVSAYSSCFRLLKELNDTAGFNINMIIDRLADDEKPVLIKSKFKEMRYDSAEDAAKEILRRISLLKNQIGVADSDSAQSLDEQIKKLRAKTKK